MSNPVNDSLKADLSALRIDASARTQQQSPLMKWGFRIVAIGALSAAGLAGARYASEHMGKQVVHVEAATLETASQAQSTLTASGYVVARRVARVGPELIGRVVRVMVREGQEVEQGQVLYVLDASESESRVRAARARALAASASVATAQAAVTDLEQQLARQEGLLSTGAGARATVEDLRSRVAVQRASLEAARLQARAGQAETMVAQTSLDRLEVHAPMKGVILNAPPEVGDVVMPERSVVEIADFASLEVEADVPEARLSSIKIGATTEIALDAYPNNHMEGEVSEIGRRVNRAKATIVVRSRFRQQDSNALPEMSARVSFLRDGAVVDTTAVAELSVPENAVITRDGRTAVFVVDDGKVHQRSVTVARTERGRSYLSAGIQSGDSVVIDPASRLRDGDAVRIE